MTFAIPALGTLNALAQCDVDRRKGHDAPCHRQFPTRCELHLIARLQYIIKTYTCTYVSARHVVGCLCNASTTYISERARSLRFRVHVCFDKSASLITSIRVYILTCNIKTNIRADTIIARIYTRNQSCGVVANAKFNELF